MRVAEASQSLQWNRATTAEMSEMPNSVSYPANGAIRRGPASDSVGLSVANGIATIRLNRPDQLNRLSFAMQRELADALTRASTNSEVRALLVTGAGRAFCAGSDPENEPVASGDLSSRATRTAHERQRHIGRNFQNLGIPVVCAINGIAAGAGVDIAFACDVAIASRSASFALTFCNVGRTEKTAETCMPRFVLDQRSASEVLRGRTVSAAQAAKWGLIWRCVEDHELASEAWKLACALGAEGSAHGAPAAGR